MRNRAELKKVLESAMAEELFQELYGWEASWEVPHRYIALADGLAAMEGGVGPLRVFTAPGRTELCGNHTDHNLGMTLAASIHLDVVGIACPRQDKIVVFRSSGYPDVVVDLSDLSPRENERGTTESLVRGVAAEFARLGAVVRGCNICADSIIPKGSGLSSSAAVEVLLAKIYDSLNMAGTTSLLELAKIAQRVENVYFGKPCGLMDQAASAIGGTIFMDFSKDPIQTEVFAFSLAGSGYTLCVVNTGGTHADLTQHYAAIPSEMQSIATLLGKSHLVEIERLDFLAHTVDIRARCGDRAFLRALHFFNENLRVAEMKALLETPIRTDGFGTGLSLQDLLDITQRSGDSSWKLLQNINAMTNPREQNIAFGLALTEEFITLRKGFLTLRQGASRIHGGGFAGSIQAYIPTKLFSAYQAIMEDVFGVGSVIKLFLRPVGTVELFVEIL